MRLGQSTTALRSGQSRVVDGGGVLSWIVEGGGVRESAWVLHSCICANTRCCVANLHMEIHAAAWLICIFAKIRFGHYG